MTTICPIQKKKFQKIKNLRFERRDRFRWKEREKNSEINMKNAAESWGEVLFQGFESEKNGHFYPIRAIQKKNFKKLKIFDLRLESGFIGKSVKKIAKLT